MNNGIFIGRLTRDAILRNTTATMPDGSPVKALNATIATNTRRVGKDVLTDYVEFTLWRKQAEALAPYLKKRKRIMVSGDVHANSYTTADGRPGINLKIGTVKEIELLDDGRPQEATEEVVDDGIPFEE